MKFKTITTMMMTAVMALALVGCGSSESTTSSTKANTQDTKAAAREIVNTIPGGLRGKNVLVAYYSWSGNTKKVAEQIHSEVGGDIVAVEPEKAYPKEYQECVDVAKKEANDNVRPAVATKVDNMDQYDVVFVGYPIWWYKAPMHMYTFLESYSFNGKVIVPFCTSGGSPIDGSIPDIQKSAKGATIVKGSQYADPAKVSQWLKDIQAVQ